FSECKDRTGVVVIRPSDLAKSMCNIATDEELGEPDKPFITPRKVGYLLKRLRFRRPVERSSRGKAWEATRQEIEDSARAYGLDVPDKALTDEVVPDEALTDEAVPF